MLLAIGVSLIVAITVVVVAVWGIVGGVYTPTNSSGQNQPTGSAGESKCSHCKSVKSYYNGLNWFQKAIKLIWYGYKKIECAMNGCPI